MNLRINDWLTISRIFSTPFIIILFYTTHYKKFALILFALSCLTDALDGYVARYFKTESKFGKMMDPLADKWLALSMLLMLANLNQMDHVAMLAAYLILFREIAVMGIRMFSKTHIIASSWLGKMKTLFLNIGIFLILYNLIYANVGSGIIYKIGKYMLLLASVFSIISGARYYKMFLSYNNALNKTSKKVTKTNISKQKK